MPREHQARYHTGPTLTAHEQLWLPSLERVALYVPGDRDIALLCKLPHYELLACQSLRTPLAIAHERTGDTALTTLVFAPASETPIRLEAYSDLADPLRRRYLSRAARQSHLDLYFYNEHLCGIARRRLSALWKDSGRSALAALL